MSPIRSRRCPEPRIIIQGSAMHCTPPQGILARVLAELGPWWSASVMGSAPRLIKWASDMRPSVGARSGGRILRIRPRQRILRWEKAFLIDPSGLWPSCHDGESIPRG